MNGTEKNNKVFIMGEIVSEATFSHEVYGEGFYDLKVKVMRLSGQADILPVTVSERLISERDLKVGSTLCAVGQFRSYNKLENGRSRLMLTVFVREPVDAPPAKNPNSIVLSGYICKPPVYRTTPFNREIADLLVAVNRAYNKSDYIPCIAWGRNARFVKNLQVGDKIALSGRIQSREYQKKISEYEVKTMTAYEVSISKLAAFDSAEEFDLEQEFNLYTGAAHAFEHTEGESTECPPRQCRAEKKEQKRAGQRVPRSFLLFGERCGERCLMASVRLAFLCKGLFREGSPPEEVPLLALCLVLVLDCPMRAAVDAGGAAGAIDAVFEPDQELHAVIHLAGDAFVQDLFEGAGDLVLPQRKKFDERFLRFHKIHAALPPIASSAVCAG